MTQDTESPEVARQGGAPSGAGAYAPEAVGFDPGCALAYISGRLGVLDFEDVGNFPRTVYSAIQDCVRVARGEKP